MTFDTNAENIEWIADRLYLAKRDLQASGVAEPRFVLLTKNKDERERVEKIIFCYLGKKYGLNFEKPNWDVNFSGQCSTEFTLPNGLRVNLIDLQ